LDRDQKYKSCRMAFPVIMRALEFRGVLASNRVKLGFKDTLSEYS
jgi:hypothetical protein